MGRKLYVGNLNYRTTEDELRDIFGADGRQVDEVAIILDRETGRPRGFGFVTMSSDEDAQKAIEALDGQMVGGRTLKVNESQERRGPPRGRGGPRGPRAGGRGDGPRGGGYGDRSYGDRPSYRDGPGGRPPRDGPRERDVDRGGGRDRDVRGRRFDDDRGGGGSRDDPLREVVSDDFRGPPDGGDGGRGRREAELVPPEMLADEGRDRGRRRRKGKGKERHRSDFDDEW